MVLQKGHKINVGRKHSQETKRKMSESHKGWRNYNYGLHHSKETKEKISKSLKGINKGIKRPYSSKRMIKMNKDPRFIKKRLKGLMKRPNKPERKLIRLISEHKFPFKYVGNGEFILGGKCPDFMNCDGQKQIIELFGRAFHDPKHRFKKKIPYHQTYEGTIKHYEKYGFKCLVIWDDKLNNPQKVINKIEDFMKLRG